MTALLVSSAPFLPAPRLRVLALTAAPRGSTGPRGGRGRRSLRSIPAGEGALRPAGVVAPSSRSRGPGPAGGAVRRPVTRPRSRPHAVGAPLRLTRRGRLALTGLSAVVATAALLAALGGVGAGEATAQSGRPTVEPRRAVLVHPGDSLWSLAAGIDPGSDRRDVIDEIVRINDLPSSQVSAGQTLLLPAG